MEYRLFYSWQTDTGDDKSFVREALDIAVGGLKAKDSDLYPVVETGMSGEGGLPEVASVMFKKIARSAIFVADVTLVGAIPSVSAGGIKKTANPNVLIELGYAASSMGWSRIICVMNEQYGGVSELPVDIRNRRWPITFTLNPQTYKLSDESAKEGIRKTRKALAEDLKAAITSIVDSDFEAVEEASRKLDANCILVMSKHGKAKGFLAPNPGNVSFGAADGGTLTLNVAVPRLLDLGIIECGVDPIAKQYAYFWTYLGNMVLKKHCWK